MPDDKQPTYKYAIFECEGDGEDASWGRVDYTNDYTEAAEGVLHAVTEVVPYRNGLASVDGLLDETSGLLFVETMKLQEVYSEAQGA